MEEMMKVRHGFSMATIGKDGGRKTMSYLKLGREKKEERRKETGKLQLFHKTHSNFFFPLEKALLRLFCGFRNKLSRAVVPYSSDQGITELILLAKDLSTRQSFHVQQIQHFPEASHSHHTHKLITSCASESQNH